jgi:hypothetical protein
MSLVAFRAAAVLLALFAAGHTWGFLHFVAPSPEARAVRASMDTVPMHVGSATFTYGGFYVGFGLFVTAYLLFSAIIAWQLPRLSVMSRDSFLAFGWGLALVQVASAILSAIYFSAPPTIFSVLVVLCVAGGVVLSPGTSQNR